ncbi:hypothetical protein HGI30_18680 [Paenibacillus albicereus]|uniref:Magnesium transporter n=1 Tax=Paenibacillus albicereus TaxID=2726185 RepID=A0A6H2H134_9BACL|nr:magnesium transporter CorA family protein [Paenibacillus albicereus]QJC53394.1 hypothetical protein HGI30_18680 [Paenibacillus albicereus]
MIHRQLNYKAGWEWHVIQDDVRSRSVLPDEEAHPVLSRAASGGRRPSDPAKGQAAWLAVRIAEQRDEQLRALVAELPFCSPWLRETEGRRRNEVHFSLDERQQPLLSGTLMVQADARRTELQPLHYWLCGSRLVTWHEDPCLPLKLQAGSWSEWMEGSPGAREAFLVLLGALLEVFHGGLDEYESRLTELERAVHSRNRTALLPVIFERRHELLHWTHLFLPIREVQDSFKEAYVDTVLETPEFQRLGYKLERIDSLLTRYTSEIDTLIAMDDAIASFRGNDIMKTLTIFTALFVPPTIAGTLWGVNFRYLPGIDSRWGFPILCASVVLFAAALYAWLWSKGWTGDLLTDRAESRKRSRRRESQAAPQSAAAAPMRSRPAKAKRPPAAAVGSRSRRPYPGQDGGSAEPPPS